MPREFFITVALVGSALLVALAASISAPSFFLFHQFPLPENTLVSPGLSRPVVNRLAPGFADADGDLVADSPADPAKRLTPDTLKFSYMVVEQDHYARVWAPFIAFLSERLGRPVEFQPFNSQNKQLAAIKNGETQIVGLNAGAVPFAVDACGFVPLRAFASEKGLATYTMQIIVPKASPIQDMKHIGGNMIAFTDTTSNAGWKAPIMILCRDFHLQPCHDFQVVYSGGHAESIRGVASGKYKVAAVASVELARAIERGDIGRNDFRVLYESSPFCNDTFGVPHNLDPKLVDAIKTAFDEYKWQGAAPKEFAKIGADRFMPVVYKNDFNLIRDIDDATGRKHEVANASGNQEAPPS